MFTWKVVIKMERERVIIDFTVPGICVAEKYLANEYAICVVFLFFC